MMILKTYSELIKLPTFEERFEYLKLTGSIGIDTFGFDRFINQNFYNSYEWRTFRREIIIRDNGGDIACPDRPISGRIILHHITPITKGDLLGKKSCLMDPENIVCVSHLTHNAIHYGNAVPEEFKLVERKPNDTCPWR